MDGTNGEDGENAVLPQIDTAPVKNSTHLITSGGVASAIENFISTETDPTVPTWVKDITQEDTLTLAKGYVHLQLQAVTKSGLEVASGIKLVSVEEI